MTTKVSKKGDCSGHNEELSVSAVVTERTARSPTGQNHDPELVHTQHGIMDPRVLPAEHPAIAEFNNAFLPPKIDQAWLLTVSLNVIDTIYQLDECHRGMVTNTESTL